ncbi:MAG: HflC protein, partial [Parcubacteria group bacterium CG_4_10_14_0_2_um_filter_41_6]
MPNIQQTFNAFQPRRVINRVVITIIALVIVFSSFGTIGAGERGILLQFGAVQDKVFGEGLYFKIPLMQRVVKIDVKMQKDEVPA